MNRLFLIFLLPFLILISGCSKKNIDHPSSTSITIKNHDYSGVENLFIEWTEMLNQNKNNYYVYIFSRTCGHCREIKNDVIEYALLDEGSLFFIEYQDSIPKVSFKEEVIGVSNIDKMGIVGVPSLFEIHDQKIVNYYLGTKEILEILEKLVSSIEN